MKSSWRDITIALAGTLQAIVQIERLAKTGYVDSEEFSTSVRTLFVTEPNNALDVYGNVAKLEHGLEALDKLLSNYRQAGTSDLFRYALGVMHIQKRLYRKKEVLNVIAKRLERAQNQVQHFGPTHDNLVRNVADIYSDTISKFQYRIQVTGNYHYLQQDRVAAQVRTLLLAGIRSAILWRQLGGSRWQFFIYRKEILESCHALLKEAKHERLSGAA